MVTIYGIKNCNTMQKAFDALLENGVEYEFHDYKKEGITASKLKEWTKLVGWETLFNKKSSTWKKLKEETGQDVSTAADAIKIMQANNSIIKRPVVEYNGTLLVGFTEAIFKEQLLT
jgi:arsenate reductase